LAKLSGRFLSNVGWGDHLSRGCYTRAQYYALREEEVIGALILGSAFGNVTYLGLPVLRGLFPNHLQQVTAVAILCEVTVSSLDLIAGSILALLWWRQWNISYVVIIQLIKFPLLWSALIAVVFNICHLPVPHFVIMAAFAWSNGLRSHAPDPRNGTQVIRSFRDIG
jgi:predicted permease